MKPCVLIFAGLSPVLLGCSGQSASDPTLGGSPAGASAASGEPAGALARDAGGERSGAQPDGGVPPASPPSTTDGGRRDAGANPASVPDAGVSVVQRDASRLDAAASGPILPPPPDGVGADGPFETTQDLASGPRGDSGVFYPSDLGRDGLRHPIFVWGCGGGSSPASYADHLNRIASHGFVAIAAISMVGDGGALLSSNLDWLLEENERPDSPFHDKLDGSRIAAGGHSIGSVNTFLWADDPRLTTTIHVAGGSLDDVDDPFAPTTGVGGMGLVHPAALICGDTDVFGNIEKSQRDFDAARVPVFFTRMTGSNHTSAARDGLPAIVAWLRWHLGDETERRAMFLDEAGEFRTPPYVSQLKNW